LTPANHFFQKRDEFLTPPLKTTLKGSPTQEDQGAGVDFFGSFFGHQRKNILNENSVSCAFRNDRPYVNCPEKIMAHRIKKF
jgi:hypothetical protein